MKANNTIEINGRLYNAATGEPIHSSASKVPVKKQALHARKSVDGFQKVKRKPNTYPQPSRQATPITIKKDGDLPQESTTLTHQRSSKVTRSAANHIKQHTKHSTTLHRQAVKKPQFQDQKEHKSTDHESSRDWQPSQPSARLVRAQGIERSNAISHFKHSSGVSTPKIFDRPTTPAEAPTSSKQQSGHATKERLINQAITAAVAQHHTEATNQPVKRRKRRSHLARYASTAALVLLIGGYIAYLNVPSISMKVAAHRAGFAAALPSYKPAGYSLSGPIAYSPGQVTINFGSNTDSRRFSLKQQPTTWDSVALLENYVTKQTPNYLTYQDRGLTIYIFNGSSAAWVNGGKMYQLEGKNSQLDTDQLLKLATSV